MGDAPLVAGAIAAAIAASAAMLLRGDRERWAAAALALAGAAALVVADAWDDARVVDLRSSAATVGLVLAGGAVAIAALAALMRRFPALFPVLAVGALPFRIPVDSGGETANLLLPLYAVIAAAVAAAIWDTARGRRPAIAPAADGRRLPGGFPELAARWLPWLLAGAVALYAAQSAYSRDFSQALGDLGFFYVPFAVLWALLVRVEWPARALGLVAAVLVAEGVLFAAVAGYQYAARDLFWNPEVMAANEIHPYFRVNSLFWDPNILSRYLAVTVVVLAAAMLWMRSRRLAIGALAIALALVATMIVTFSQTGLVALLAGLAALAALRWSARWALGVAAAAGAVALVFLLASGSSFSLDLNPSELNRQTSGRADLIEGGLKLAERRPVAGWGSGSFSKRFTRRFEPKKGDAAVSHTAPVTVAAEQGAIGLAEYGALLVACVAALLAGIGPLAPGLRGFRAAADRAPPGGAEGTALAIARAAVFAGFAAMFVHSLSYAAFLTDPITWALLAVGLALVRAD